MEKNYEVSATMAVVPWWGKKKGVATQIKRDSHLQKVHEEEYCQYEDHCANNFSTLRLFSETEETVRPSSLTSIYENYKELKELWDWCYDEYQDKEAKTRIHHVQSQMQTFEYFFFNWDLLFFSLGIVIKLE